MTSSKFTKYNVVSYETQGLGLIRIPLSDLVLIFYFFYAKLGMLYGTPPLNITASSLHQKRPKMHNVRMLGTRPSHALTSSSLKWPGMCIRRSAARAASKCPLAASATFMLIWLVHCCSRLWRETSAQGLHRHPHQLDLWFWGPCHADIRLWCAVHVFDMERLAFCKSLGVSHVTSKSSSSKWHGQAHA